MASFLERQKNYTAFRHSLAICAELHRHAEHVPSIPSYLIATYAAHLELCVNAEGTTHVAYSQLVEARNKDLYLAEEDVSIWKKFLAANFQVPIVDHEDVIRPMVFANLLVSDVQHGREALQKVISSINAALFEHPYSTEELLCHHLAPEQIRQMAKNIEFWRIRILGFVTRSRYRRVVGHMIDRLTPILKNKLWDEWRFYVTRYTDIELSHEHAVSLKPVDKKKRKKRGKKKAKSAQVQDTQLNSVMDPKNIDENDTSHVQASEILSEDETTDDESVEDPKFSTPSVEQSQPLGHIPERKSRHPRFAEVESCEKLWKERLKDTKQGLASSTEALGEDTKLLVSQRVTATEVSAAIISGQVDRNSRQQLSEHARHNLASQETQENETSHVSTSSAAKEEHPPGAVSMSTEDLKNAAPANKSTSDTQKGILLSILQSHTTVKDKAASESVQAIEPFANRFSSPPPTQHTSTPINNPYTILGTNTTYIFPSDTTDSDPDPHPSPADDEISLPHASHLISLSLFLLSHSRSTTPLPSPLSEIFSASTTSINAWLDTPRIWHDAAIAAALHEEVEVLQDVSRRYGELGEARRGIEGSRDGDGGETGKKLWDVYREAAGRYMVALRELGRRVPETSGYMERFLKMLGEEEKGRLGEVFRQGDD